MENNFVLKCRITAALSFAIGTIFFAVQLYFNNWDDLAYLGLFFILLATVVNGFLVISLVVSIALYPKRWLLYTKTIGLLLLNIPIAFAYFYLLLEY